ncbi:MAG TPA: S-adenosylmethionine decarboxylase [Gammaproteobacteria bacterium]|nr:S-adenosylmethionine decarboxylase [Gammaproteobacteria bacterium]
MSNNKPWGQHLILDLGGCNDNICRKKDIRVFVKELVDEIDMVAYGEPIIVHFAEHSYEAAGYSLVQLIETSAIMGHFSDNNRDAYLDIFSCKSIDQDAAINVVRKHFAPDRIHAAFLERGIDLPLRPPFVEYTMRIAAVNS